MTEKEKMLAGDIYDANNDAELLHERGVCQQLCHELNQTSPLEVEARQTAVKRLFGATKGTATVVSPFVCDYGWNVRVGENFFINAGGVMLDEAPITFGDNVFIGPQCGFYTAIHPLDAPRRNAGLEYARPIVIGSNVWIGGHVTVLPGVRIGDGAVIGAGSVVTKDVPPRVVAVGNPCRVLRQIEDVPCGGK